MIALVDGAPSDEAQIERRELGDRTEITVVLPRGGTVDSIGVRLPLGEARKVLRNGYTSWDGSTFLPAGTEATGHLMTALVSETETRIIGFLRHDRFQSRLRFAADHVDVETLIDRVPHEGEIRSETTVMFSGGDTEEQLRRWARLVAEAAPTPPRIPARRITGWCSWYNLYSSLDEPVLREHLAAARRFRDEKRVPFDVFLVDDGFTPEMGDWLRFKPQFPNGIKPVLDEARGGGFTPGLWIAPFMVGNRSRLHAEHPDWVVQRVSGGPLAAMKFYGEFRWHKRSEEYYVLDVTHPEAEAYIRSVFRTWRHEWGCGYFKTDFMHLGSMFGPDVARWHRGGLSCIAIWVMMARLIREEIGDALWLCCGAPLLPPIGLCDAMRIGRDVGPKWSGDQSAEALLRDQTTRNYMGGIFWQADPDCILLRDRFHDLSEAQVRSLAVFAGLSGGLLMTSDNLDDVPEERRSLLAELIGDGRPFTCDFPELGREPDKVLVQRVGATINLFNTGDAPATRTIGGQTIALGAHESRRVTVDQ